MPKDVHGAKANLNIANLTFLAFLVVKMFVSLFLFQCVSFIQENDCITINSIRCGFFRNGFSMFSYFSSVAEYKLAFNVSI